jgi:hypothetical protein
MQVRLTQLPNQWLLALAQRFNLQIQEVGLYSIQPVKFCLLKALRILM